jgi:hypothetical protein
MGKAVGMRGSVPGGGKGEDVEKEWKGEDGANTVYSCTKMEDDTVETIPGLGVGRAKEWWRGEFNYDILDTT